MYYTTLNQIVANNPCHGGWTRLLRHLGKTESDDEPLDFATILSSNGLSDALWALRTTVVDNEVLSTYAADCIQDLIEFLPAKPTEMEYYRVVNIVGGACQLKTHDAAAAKQLCLDLGDSRVYHGDKCIMQNRHSIIWRAE